MKRRRFLQAAGAVALAAWAPAVLRAQSSPRPQTLPFADMHAHLRFKQANTMRQFMSAHGMLVVAEKVVADVQLIRWSNERRTFVAIREAVPGELRRDFERQFAQTIERMRLQDLVPVTSIEALDRVLGERIPGIVPASEGADFLEGDLGYLKAARARGLVHLQLVHYRVSDVGDISTEAPVHGGLTAFGKDVVRECNRVGILVDVAHATSSGIDQALEISTRPIVYSHGHVAAAMPSTWMGGVAARAIHAPLARKLAQKGGVLGLWPLWISYANMNLYADELMRMADAYGPMHVGIGSDMDGLGRSAMPSYAEFAVLPEYLARRGLNDAGIAGIVGGNYVRVLRQALSA